MREDNYVTNMKKNKVIMIMLGVLAGLINGLFGTGAGLVLIPALRATTKMDNRKIYATTIFIVMLMCVFNFVVFILNGKLNFEIGIWCVIGSVFGAFLGATLLQKLNEKVINIIFSFVLILAGILMIVF